MNAMPGFQTPSIFPQHPASFFPTVDSAVRGAERAKYGKEPFKLTSYNVKVFNMAKDSDREEYCRLMERLMPLIIDVKCVVSKNELQVLNTPDGNGWYRYVEWYEYELNNKSLTTLTTSREEEQKREDREYREDLDEEDSTDSGFSTDGFL